MKLEDLEAKLGIANMGEEEKLALVKDIQANIPALKAEQRVLEAKTQANLVVEAIKKIKEGLEARFDELNGIVDVKVRNITSGKDGLQGPKGDQGDRGFDGTNGKDGYNGKDGIDGVDGKDGVGVQDAYIDFDGSLIIKLTDGKELNVGEVVPMDVAEKIKIIGNGGGTSQSVLDSLTSLQDQINTLTGIDGTLGTIAQQDANNVAITGGTINGATVGATTPAAGTFTTLTATGQTSLGGAAGIESVRVNATGGSSGSNNYVDLYGTFGSGDPLIASAGTGANAGLGFRIKGTGAYKFGTGGSSANIQFQVSNTASAVNYVQVTGAATGSGPIISAQGSDSNIALNLRAKGGQPVTTEFYHRIGIGYVNYLQLTGNNTGVAPVISVIGSDTNIPLVLQPKGTGALQAQQTDSTATGGNARGANAVDWQTLRDTAAKVASGAYSFLGGGRYNQATGNDSVTVGGNGCLNTGSASIIVGGYQNVNTSANHGIVTGGYSNNIAGQWAFIGGGYSNSAQGYYNFIGGGFTNSGTASASVTTQSATMNGTTAVTLSGSNANIKVGQLITGTNITTFPATYVAAVSGTSLTLSQAASGSSTSTLSFFTPHGVVVGGGNNQATGSYSFIGGGGDAGTAANRNVASGDWSTVGGGLKNSATNGYATVCGGNNNTVSGSSTTYGFIGGGQSNTVSGFLASVIGGYGNNANSAYSTASGNNTTTRSIQGVFAYSAGAFSATGDAQWAVYSIRKSTTDATPSVLTTDTSAASNYNQVILPNNSAYYFRGEVIAGVTGGGNTKGWTIEGVIKRGANAASTTVVGVTVSSMYADAGAVTWTIAAAADTTNGGLKITATGQAATTIRWVCKIETTEMTF